MEDEMVEGEAVAQSVGERLRSAREAAGLSLEDVATTTRIPTRHLESLEASDFTRLPAPTYTVGFAKNYASAIGLDREEIGDQVRAELGSTRPPTAAPDLFEPADPARVMPRWLIFAAIGAILVAALIFSWLNRRSMEAPDDVALENVVAPPAAQPAVAPPAQAQGPVVITASDQVWLSIKDGAITLKEGLLEAGQSFEVPVAATAPTLTTGKPEALRISVGNTVVAPIGPAATTVTDVSLKPADLLSPRPAATVGTQAEPPAQARATPAQPAPRRAPPRAAPRPPAPAPTEPQANAAQPTTNAQQ